MRLEFNEQVDLVGQCVMRIQSIFIVVVLMFLTGCASQPRGMETVWVTVVQVYSPEDMQRPWNQALLSRARAVGISEKDIKAGRLLRVACGLGTDYTWGSYGYLPQEGAVRVDEIVRLKVEDPSNDDRLGLNPVLGRVEDFGFPGSTRAYRYLPDWKEKGRFLNFERIPLAPEQEGHYEISHGNYVIKCRQP